MRQVVDLGTIVSIGPASLDRLSLEYLVTLGERDPGLLTARPKIPRRPQPRRIVEAAGTHTDYAAARLAIKPTCTIRAYEPGVQPTAIRIALECSGFNRSKAEARLRHGDLNEKGLLVWCGQAAQWHV